MNCANHDRIVSIDTCAACARQFCIECLVLRSGRSICKDCARDVDSSGATLAPPDSPVLVDAQKSMWASLIGLTLVVFAFLFASNRMFSFGVLFSGIGLEGALRARRKIAADPELSDDGSTGRAVLLGAIGLAVWALVLARNFGLFG